MRVFVRESQAQKEPRNLATTSLISEDNISSLFAASGAAASNIEREMKCDLGCDMKREMECEKKRAKHTLSARSIFQRSDGLARTVWSRPTCQMSFSMTARR